MTCVRSSTSSPRAAMLFVVPVFYIAFEFLQEKIRKPMEVEADLQVLQEQEKSANERENHK